MKEHLQNQLFEKYPLLYADSRSPVSRSPFTDYGIECGNGWFEIVNNLSARLEQGIRAWQAQNPDEIDKHPRVAQVKEKFGGLRFYMDYPGGFSKDLYEEFEMKLIGPTEELSYTVCEVCGCEGEKRNLRWIRTLCETCYNERKEK